MSYEVALLVFGIILLLVGLVGKVKARELEVGTSSRTARIVLASLGAALIALSFNPEGAKDIVRRLCPGRENVAAETSGACNNERDLSKICYVPFDTEFVEACNEQHGGDAAGVSACLQRNPSGRPGLSKSCADCYGAQMQCIRDKCILGGGHVCREPVGDMDACGKCRFFNCDLVAFECKVGRRDLNALNEICEARKR